MHTDVQILHVGVALLSCTLTGMLAWATGLPTMYRDVHTFFHSTAAIAAMHAIVAAYGRVERIYSHSIAGFYVTMNTATWTWVSIQHAVPADAFIMLSTEGMNGLSLRGWVLAVLSFLIVGSIILHNVTQMKRRPYLHRNMPMVSALLLTYTAAAATDPAFHLHHYMWAGALALLCQCDTFASAACQSIALGIANQELAFGDIQPFFDV